MRKRVYRVHEGQNGGSQSRFPWIAEGNCLSSNNVSLCRNDFNLFTQFICRRTNLSLTSQWRAFANQTKHSRTLRRRWARTDAICSWTVCDKSGPIYSWLTSRNWSVRGRRHLRPLVSPHGEISIDNKTNISRQHFFFYRVLKKSSNTIIMRHRENLEIKWQCLSSFFFFLNLFLTFLVDLILSGVLMSRIITYQH